MAGGPQKVKQPRVSSPPLPGSGRGRVPVPTAPSLPIAAGPTREDPHEGLREQRRERRRVREAKAAEREARRRHE